MKASPRKNTPIETTTYLLRDVDRNLWDRAQIKAIRDHLSMRAVLIGLVKAYVRDKAEPIP